jgi:hypothetical protein
MTEDLKSRIERVALCADLASHYIQDMRVMPAEGVKMVQRDALARIEELEAKLQDMALDCLAAQGQAEEAYQAQLAAEAKLAEAVGVMEALIDAHNANLTVDEIDVLLWEVQLCLIELKGD